mgnify:CR=1 FL=1
MVLNGKVEEITYSDVSVKELLTLLTQASSGIANLENAVMHFGIPGEVSNAVTIKIETFKEGLPRITFTPVCMRDIPVGDTPAESAKGAAPKLNNGAVV